MGEQRCTSLAAFMAVSTFVLSGTLPIRAIWIETPALSRQVPEGSNLYIYLLMISECSNISAILYLLVRKCSSQFTNEVRLIYASLMLGLTSMVVLGLFWRSVVPGVKNSFSFTLFSSALLASIVHSLSTVTYIPFVSRLKESYMNAAMFGEALSSLIPHILATVQGIGLELECFVSDSNTAINASFTIFDLPRPTAQAVPQHSTIIQRTRPPLLQFSEQVYFLVHAGFITLSLLCFIAVRCTTSFSLSGIQSTTTDAEVRGHCADDALKIHSSGADVCKSKKIISRQTTVLDDGTIRQSSIVLHPPKQAGHSCAEQTPLTGDVPQSHSDDCETASDFNNHPLHLSRRPSKSPGTKPLRRFARATSADCAAALKATTGAKPKLFPLLMIIALWSSYLLNGPLSSVYTYSCYSVGNNIFLVGLILCDILALLSSILSSRTTEMSVVIAFTCLGTILLTYFMALIIFTVGTQARDFPLFSNTGEILAMCIWVAIVGLFSFARLRIGIECHVASMEAVLWYVWITRLGDIIGLLTIFRRVSICRIFRIFDKPCFK